MRGTFLEAFREPKVWRIQKEAFDSLQNYIMTRDIHNKMLFAAPTGSEVERILVRVLMRSGVVPLSDTGVICHGKRWFRLLIFTKGGKVLLKGEFGRGFVGVLFGRRIDRWVKFAVMKKIFERKGMNDFVRDHAKKCMNLEAIRELSLLWMSWKSNGGNSFKRFAAKSPRMRVLKKHLKLNRYHAKRFSKK